MRMGYGPRFILIDDMRTEGAGYRSKQKDKEQREKRQKEIKSKIDFPR